VSVPTVGGTKVDLKNGDFTAALLPADTRPPDRLWCSQKFPRQYSRRRLRMQSVPVGTVVT
jgi:hypothetical protein